MLTKDVRDGLVVLYRGRGFISSAIRWQTRSQFSHTSLLFADRTISSIDQFFSVGSVAGKIQIKSSGHEIIESWQGAGVQATKLGGTEGIRFYRIHSSAVDADFWQRAHEFCSLKINMRYDYRSVFQFVTRSRPAANDAWFCSELVFAALRHAGLDLLARIDPHEVSPGMLALSPYLKEI